MAFQWSVVPKDTGPEPVDGVALGAELALRAELSKLSVTGLQERAFVERVDATAVANASLDNDDEHNKRRALIKLIVEHALGGASHGRPASDGQNAGKTTSARRRVKVPDRPQGRALLSNRLSNEAARLPHVPATNLEPSLQHLS